MTMTTTTTTATATTTEQRAVLDRSLMQLLWLASPALPVGGFSYSEGLEAAVEQGLLGNEAEVTAWLADQLQLGLARSELPVLAHAIGAWQQNDQARIGELNNWVLHTRETSELRAQTEQMGRSLTECLRQRSGIDPAQLAWLSDLPPTYPLAFALAASSSGAPLHSCLVSFAFGWAENMVQATIKSMPIGQSGGQRILQQLMADIPGVVDSALALDFADQQAFTPGLAILSSQHEVQYSRLFRS